VNPSTKDDPLPSLRRRAAGMINGRMRRPWQDQDLAIFSAHCHRARPWRFSTGPISPEGKMRSRENGRKPKRKRRSTHPKAT